VLPAGEVRGQTRDWSVVPKNRTGEEPLRQGNGRGSDQDLTRLAKIGDDQELAASDQSGSDADQTDSDADQTTSEVDRELSGRDQQASERDQVASDRDQALSDRELVQHPGDDAQASHDANLADRQRASMERRETGRRRTIAAEERARQAQRRDETAWHRDLTAQARDTAAQRRDRDSAKIERKMASRAGSLRTALTHAAEVRALAAADRARAADDRAQAAIDRERAAEERAQAVAELRRAHLDELTGAFRRGAGEQALQGEIDRARRGDGTMVLAFVDVDGLREVNNREGHPAGDALLCNVVSAIRSQIRSFEPIVRVGGDEFLCAVAGVDLGQAEERFIAIRDSLAETTSGATVSVGLAELGDQDTLADLIERADAALLEFRRDRSAS
jgi:diguanylate cyclase (GGDEF)-like protein